MDFRIADSFTDSLARLTGEEQKSVKTTAFDLQINPAHPSFQLHKLEKAKDKRFWSIRVSSDIRVILHRTETSLLLCYAGHHDDAYHWAERRKLDVHPKTGAAQFVEIRETVQEVAIPRYVDAPSASQPRLFDRIEEDQLLHYGVPAEWLADVRNATEDTLLDLASHLPAEAAEALLSLATGATPVVPAPVTADPFAHPDAQRRFRLMTGVEELERALEFPWDKWTIFLHPAQRALVERDFNGPARVAGSAGTGKTIVALHRAVFLARSQPESRVLLTTFSETLANALRYKLRSLIHNQPRLAERLEVYSMDAIGNRLHEIHVGAPALAPSNVIRELLLRSAAAIPNHKFSSRFLIHEWEQVVDAWQLTSWEAYRDVARLGRKTRLPEPQRAILWAIFEHLRQALQQKGLRTQAEVFHNVTAKLRQLPRPPFDNAVVDEAQDIGIQQLRFLAALSTTRPNSLFFAGDLGQRIFQQPFSWKSLGVDVRGRSVTLRINYRTSHQIRQQADRLLGPETTDVDGNSQDRRGATSTFNGPPPQIHVLPTASEEIDFAAGWLSRCVQDGLAPHEFGIFVRSSAQIDHACAAVEKAGLPYKVLGENLELVTGRAAVGTMHLAKGLEFRAVAIIACSNEVIPLQQRIEAVSDDADLEEVYDTERHLLYVACTRARDQLLVTASAPASEFLDDLRGIDDSQ